MGPSIREKHSATRLFMGYAALSLVPILALGLVLARSYGAAANSRGLVQAQSQAELFASTAIEPLLDGTDLRRGLSTSVRASLRTLADATSADGAIPRLRVRDVDGRVVFSGDGSGLNSTPEEEAVDAGRGEPVALLTHLNADENDTGPLGSRPSRFISHCTPSRIRTRSACSRCTCRTRRFNETWTAVSTRSTEIWDLASECCTSSWPGCRSPRHDVCAGTPSTTLTSPNTTPSPAYRTVVCFIAE